MKDTDKKKKTVPFKKHTKPNCHNYKQRLFEKKNAIPNFSIQEQNETPLKLWSSTTRSRVVVTNQPLSRHFTVRCPHWPSVVKFKQLTELEKQLNLQVEVYSWKGKKLEMLDISV